MKKKFRVLSLISFIISIIIFVLSYFMFHYLTDSGFTSVWQAEAGKPFVTELFADLGVLFLFSSIISLIISFIFFGDRK
ncbi:MAG: hypothetical protein IJ945_00145 [Oscillospiraceae bacterium]|nr:hypothetical protein [Oscillospiraceae bacterium]